MEIRSRNNNIPDWTQSFLSTFYATHQVEHEAAINVKTLPKVVWNDNTFYVALDVEEGNADVFNEYGNVVTALKDVKSIDDVEQQLNKHVVAANSNVRKKNNSNFDDALAKVADTLGVKFTDESNDGDGKDNGDDKEKVVTADANTGAGTGMVQPAQSNMQTTDPSINQSVNTATNTPTDTSSAVTSQQIDSAVTQEASLAVGMEKQKATLKSLKAQLTSTTKLLKQNQLHTQKLQQEFKNYQNDTAKTITKLAKIVNSLQDQLHAYINPGNVYDLNSQELERKHFEQTAIDSARAIESEHKVDLTTPRGRASLKDQILQDLEAIKMPTEILSVEEASPLENEIASNDACGNCDGKTCNNNCCDDSCNSSCGNDSCNDGKCGKDGVKVTIVQAAQQNKKFLNQKEASTFKTRVCPICKTKSLTLGMKTASVQDVLCSSCKAKFGVDLNTEDIFKY